MPAQQAFLPRTLEAERLPSANALLQGTLPARVDRRAADRRGRHRDRGDRHRLRRGLGVVLRGGARRALISARGAVPVASATPSTVPQTHRPAGTSRRRRFRASVRDGIRYAIADPPLRTTLLLSLVLNFALNGPAAVGMPWLAEIRFDAGPDGPRPHVRRPGRPERSPGRWSRATCGPSRQGATLLAPGRRRGRRDAGRGHGADGCRSSIAALAVMGVCIGYVNIVAISWLQARVPTDMVGPGHEPRDADGLRDHAALAGARRAPCSTSTRPRCSSARGSPRAAGHDRRRSGCGTRRHSTPRRPRPARSPALPAGSVTVNRAPPAGACARLDRPAVRLRDPPRDRQPETRAAGSVAGGARQARERLEDPLAGRPRGCRGPGRPPRRSRSRPRGERGPRPRRRPASGRWRCRPGARAGAGRAGRGRPSAGAGPGASTVSRTPRSAASAVAPRTVSRATSATIEPAPGSARGASRPRRRAGAGRRPARRGGRPRR